LALALAASNLAADAPAPAGAAVPTRSVFAAGDAGYLGSTGETLLSGPLVDMAAAPGGGYWQLGSDGGVFAYGGAPFFGSTGDMTLNKPVVSMSSTSGGAGYWFVASDGGIFAYGDAGFFGSTGDMTLNKPVVGMAPTSTGRGYLLVSSDGGVFAFGDAKFTGSLGAEPPAAPVVSLTPHPSGDGYWLLDEDGRVYPFGAARHHGQRASAGSAMFTDIEAAPSGDGYWILRQGGVVDAYGDAADLAPEVVLGPGQRAIGVAATADGGGLWVTTTGRHVPRTAGASGPHTFLTVDRQGHPARWDPCTPITWLFNPALAPAGAEELLRDGFDYVSAITGLTFRYGGTTTVTPGPTVPGTIIVGWVPSLGLAPAPGQSGPVPAGRAYPASTPVAGGALRVTAAGIRLNADFIDGRDPELAFFWMPLGWRAYQWGPVFLHELGHVLGLGHVDDTRQLMGYETTSAVTYGPGDLAGLHRLGAAAGCL
jgi:hypothetical protein